ncbi:MAG TPA: tetratricopeptide repeat protein [Xanthobacteraceae bacterium]|nr:tetratricopeptide repeat protein [Xanthobacteraceae bacterium]
MEASFWRGLAAATGLIWLTACETTSTKLTDIFKPETTAAITTDTLTGETVAVTPPAPAVAAPDRQPTGSIMEVSPSGAAIDGSAQTLLGGDPYDDLAMAKRFFRDGNYGLSERYYRRAAEARPRDAEAWLGLAASYDRLKRFDLADRAYSQLLRLTGPTADVLNNVGYSYMLRGDYGRARQKLREALAQDPDNMYVRTNLELLEESRASRKAIR